MTNTITEAALVAFLTVRHPSAAETRSLLCIFGDWFTYMRADFVY